MEERTVEYWLDIAQYDLDTAEAMWQTKRWLYVAFMCHQSIEKTLKAYWSGTREDDPPYMHNHKRLADGCGLYQRMGADQRRFIELQHRSPLSRGQGRHSPQPHSRGLPLLH